ncbi:MAG: 30S ribosomal protein S16 [Dehalococcoidia bacterium]|nr:30S ribosomal protein S16 [Chloroflexota bacterium]MBT9159096.1 30S ribosomal protein S16 [Chloroflexota bacterium]MBT9161503.1 30S ribosomal protein S16 [Chloroflexota bacterium]
MVRLRLQRTGRRNRPSYRIVAADSRAPRDGAFIEILGHYDPLIDPATVVIDHDKALKWLRVGAKPTETVTSLLRKQGIWDKFESEEKQ